MKKASRAILLGWSIFTASVCLAGEFTEGRKLARDAQDLANTDNSKSKVTSPVTSNDTAEKNKTADAAHKVEEKKNK